MANNRISLRSRLAGPQRVKINADENATSKHLRQPSGIVPAGASRPTSKDFGGKAAFAASRPALGEVTTAAVNRKPVATGKFVPAKDKPEAGLKRSRSSSLALATAPQRVPLGPARAVAPVPAPINSRSLGRAQGRVTSRKSIGLPRRVIKGAPRAVEEDYEVVDDLEMEVEEVDALAADDSGEREVEAMVRQPELDSEDEAREEEYEEAEEEPEDETARVGAKRAWPEMSTPRAKRCRREVDAVRAVFDDRNDVFDETMVSDYAEDIFAYMEELEVDMMPTPDYIAGQAEITWQMRETLVDWLLQVHLRYHMLPETLWIAVNLIDRFLSKRVVSLVKLQLVGVTALFIAAKYEEILAPSVDEFVFLTEGGYTREEILKGEGIVLQTVDFRVSQYCSPYSWMRRISKADDYDIQTRTLGKFLTEVTLLDWRFLAVKPSLVAAVGMYCARRMLGGDWSDGFVFYSGFTEAEVLPGHRLLVEKLCEDNFGSFAVCKKYAHKKFLKASLFAVEWARANVEAELSPSPLLGEDGGMELE